MKNKNYYILLLICLTLIAFSLVGCNNSNELQFSLNLKDGQNDVAVLVGENYVEPGYKSINDGEDITNKVVMKYYKVSRTTLEDGHENIVETKVDKIDTSTVGEYKIYYTSRRNDIATTLSRTIYVNNADTVIYQINTNINGQIDDYIPINGGYNEYGARFIIGNKILNDKIQIKIYKMVENKKEVTAKVSTNEEADFVVEYYAKNGDFEKTLTRMVHIITRKAYNEMHKIEVSTASCSRYF